MSWGSWLGSTVHPPARRGERATAEHVEQSRRRTAHARKEGWPPFQGLHARERPHIHRMRARCAAGVSD